MLGMELRFDVHNVILKAVEKGVLVLDAGRTVVRLLPPLVIEKEQIDRAVLVLDEVFGEEENEASKQYGSEPTFWAFIALQEKKRTQLTS